MNEITMNVYEAIPVLREILNLSGFCTKMLGKNSAWLHNKSSRKEFYSVVPGFNDDDILLINNGLKAVSEFCASKLLNPLSGCSDSEIYSQYASNRLKELRSIISIAYLQQNYTSMSKNTFSCKLRIALNKNGKPTRFTAKDIEEINTGILAMAETFSRMKLTL